MLWIEGRAAPELAEEYGTPLYVTSEAQIRANVRRMREAFEARWPRVTLLFATKSNANLAIRRVLVEEGVGGDCFGLGELTVSLRGRCRPRAARAERQQQAAAGVARRRRGGRDDQHRRPERARPRRGPRGAARSTGGRLPAGPALLLRGSGDPRASPTLGSRRSPPTRATTSGGWTGRRSSSSCPGARVPVASPPRPASAREQAPPDARGLRARGTPDHDVSSRSCTSATGGSRSCSISAAASRTSAIRRAAAVRQPRRRHSRAVRRSDHVDVCARRSRTARSASRTCSSSRAGVSSATRPSCSPASASSSACRPGRTTWVNVDASTNHCPRVPLQGYYYEIVHATKGLEAGDTDVSVVGPTCVVDLLGARRLPSPRQGDLLAVLDVGGYAEVLSIPVQPGPAPGDGARRTATDCDVIRRRETIDDILATQVGPGRLA